MFVWISTRVPFAMLMLTLAAPVEMAANSQASPGTNATTEARTHYQNAVVAIGTNDWQTAKNELMQAEQLAPKNALVHYDLALAYSHLGQAKTALTELNRALQIGLPEEERLAAVRLKDQLANPSEKATASEGAARAAENGARTPEDGALRDAMESIASRLDGFSESRGGISISYSGVSVGGCELTYTRTEIIRASVRENTMHRSLNLTKAIVSLDDPIPVPWAPSFYYFSFHFQEPQPRFWQIEVDRDGSKALTKIDTPDIQTELIMESKDSAVELRNAINRAIKLCGGVYSAN